MTESVTRLRAPLIEDRYGNEIPDWDNATSLVISRCAVAPRREVSQGQAEEHTAGRQGVIVGFTVYAPAGSEFLPSDRIVIRGDTFEVDGASGEWVSPWTDITEGVEINARQVDG